MTFTKQKSKQKTNDFRKSNITACESLQWARHGQVTVDADRTQVEYGGRAQQNIQGDPDFAQRPSEVPRPSNFDFDGQRHHQYSYGQIGARQARHEAISDGTEFRIREYAEYDEGVTDDCAEGDGSQDDADQNSMQQ